MNTYTYYWNDGKREVLSGETLAGALNDAGYPANTISNLNFFVKGDNKDFYWDVSLTNWILTHQARQRYQLENLELIRTQKIN